MRHLLVVDADRSLIAHYASQLKAVGLPVMGAGNVAEALPRLIEDSLLGVISELLLPDGSGLEVLRCARRVHPTLPLVVITQSPSYDTAIEALRLGVLEYLEKPVSVGRLTRTLRQRSIFTTECGNTNHAVAHALQRWAILVISVVRSPVDPRTVEGWSRCAATSRSALRMWCRCAGLSARRSLLFARLLRVILLRQRTSYRVEDLLDIVDGRTLKSLMTLAGVTSASPNDLPHDIERFLCQQRLVPDQRALDYIRARIPELIEASISTRCDGVTAVLEQTHR